MAEEEAETLTLTVEGGADERRLDQWLARQLPELTRSRIQALARQGALTDAEGRPVGQAGGDLSADVAARGADGAGAGADRAEDPV